MTSLPKVSTPIQKTIAPVSSIKQNGKPGTSKEIQIPISPSLKSPTPELNAKLPELAIVVPDPKVLGQHENLRENLLGAIQADNSIPAPVAPQVQRVPRQIKPQPPEIQARKEVNVEYVFSQRERSNYS